MNEFQDIRNLSRLDNDEIENLNILIIGKKADI